MSALGERAAELHAEEERDGFPSALAYWQVCHPVRAGRRENVTGPPISSDYFTNTKAEKLSWVKRHVDAQHEVQVVPRSNRRARSLPEKRLHSLHILDGAYRLHKLHRPTPSSPWSVKR